MSLKNRAITGLQWTSVSMLVVTFCQVAQLGILARFLEPEVFGLMAILMIVIGFSQLFMDFGLSNKIIHEQDINETQLSSLYWLNLGSGLLLTSLIFLTAPLIANFFSDPELHPPLQLLSLVFLIFAIGNQFKTLFQKDLRFKLMALVDIFAAIMSLIIAVWSALLGFGLYALIYAVLAQSLISSIAYLILGTQIYYKPSITYSHSQLKGFYSFGFYQMGEKSINYLGANIDKILIGRILGMQAVGFYNMAWQIIILPISRINPIVSKVAFPVYAKIQNNIEAMNAYYQVLIRGLSLVTIPLLAFIYFFSYEIVLVIFGQGWNTTADLLPLLALVGIVKALGNPGGSIILAKGYANIGFWWNLFWIILVTSSLYLALTFQQDILIVPKVLAAITILFGWIWHYIISIVGKIKYSSILFNFTKIVLISFLIAGLSYFASQNLKIENTLINLLANIIICLILYLPYVYFFEKDTLKQLMQGLD